MTSIATMTSPSGRVVVLAPRGVVGPGDAAALREALRPESAAVELVVVDLLDVEELDDAAVEVLVGASARCASQGIRLVVANAGTAPWLSLTRAHVAGVLRAHRRGAPPLAELLALLEL